MPQIPSTPPTTALARNNTQIASFGFVWNNKTEIVSPDDKSPIVKINGKLATPMPTSWVTEITYARPSSNHPGLVNMLYADGTVRPMSDDVGLGPYLSAVCPDDSTAILSFGDGGLNYNPSPFRLESW